MQYITGVHALNIPCGLDTCGDWHSTSIQWNHPNMGETTNSIFGEYGIERNVPVVFLDKGKKYNVANHIRALLDLMIENRLGIVNGMRDAYICNDKYTQEIFEKVAQLRQCENWNEIDKLMSKEYMMKWINYKKERSL